jgi:dTDP-4-amino-4,6-dideoxygalactose transaminase
MAKPALNVTKTALPPIGDYLEHLEGIWRRGLVTNDGPLVQDLEDRLRDALAVRHFMLVANGTLALQLAIRALDLRGDIVTTPFSYVATTSSIVWERARPVFVDIEPRTFTIDADQIETAITERTTAILATHVYGFPCDVDRIDAIAHRHGLKVVYDAAHAFGVRYRGRPLTVFGDVSALSFHATKIFHTVEGGGLATDDDDTAHRIAFMRNHGHRGQEDYWGIGINAKSSELHAAMGLCLLPRVDEFIAARRVRVELYRELLASTSIVTWNVPSDVAWNYGYLPVVFETEQAMLWVRDSLIEADVYPRRYFYPALTALPYVDAAPTPVAESISQRILCLPLHETLPLDEIERVALTVTRALEPNAQGGACRS